MKDISYIAAFPKSGITYLNFMLFHILFDRPQDARLIDSDYIFDVHESLARVPAAGDKPQYLKIHFRMAPGFRFATARRAPFICCAIRST